ncbi:MAG: Spore coat protein CotH [Chthoniobacteraceae bacterium]|nr:Spore coat protein CotH [Chthoniobacteraceae bacterium]
MGSLRLLPLFVLLSLCVLQTRLEAQFVISEFVASNVEGIVDEDGNHEDWIEIYNSGLSAATLRDWYLTDKSSQLRKWAFPDKILQPGQYLVVFASNKDRRNPAANLHTNFGLDAGGEYLALTKGETNGGTTVVQSWNEYLPQAADVSFGLVQTGGSANLISAGSAVKWLVPNSTTGPAIGTTWRGANEPFTETGWSTGVAALGLAGPPPVVGAESLQHRYNSTTNSLGYDSSGAGRNATSSGAAFLLSDTDSSVAPLKRAGVMQFIGAENDQVSIPANSAYNAASATVCFWLRANLPAGAGNAGAMLWDRRPDYAMAGLVIIQQDDGKIGLQSNNAYSSLSGAVNVSDNAWHHVAVTINQGAGEPVAVYVDGELDSSINNTAAWSWTTAQAIELGRSHDAFWRRYTGLLDDVRFYSRLLTPLEIQQIAQGADSLMGTSLFSTTGVDAADISTQLAGMASVNSSAYVRIPFTASAPATLGGVRLTVRFCDGLKAWINGTEVASFNAPAIPLWDSIATGAHDPGRSRLQTVTIPASGLKAGANVLALQVLNNGASDPNVLLRPVLDALPLGSGTSSYLVTPTPGGANSAGLAALGPHISRTTNNPVRPVGGTGSAPLLITTRVQARLGPVASVQLAYRVMWGAELLVTMQQGANGDFSAQIPTSDLKAGDMLRWRIIAKDTANTQSTDPLFLNLDGVAGADTDQYFGTVAQEGGYNTQLPVLYWFVQNPNGISPGTQCSIFYRDRFYDYVGVSIHGQSTQSFPKKSLNLSFNKGNRFAWAPGEAEIRSVNLLSDYADKSKVRNTMAYETWHSMQHPASHFSNLLHVRQATGTAPAAAFYGLYDMVEDGNEEFLARCGLDENGALYKMYNSLESTSGAEKKTREFENVSDLQALIDGVNPGTKSVAQRRQYAYDNVDIPALINFAAVNTMILNTDWGHKNYYVYRDTLGTKEWMPIPWDQDLSFGHCYTGAQGYFDDDIRSQGGLVVGGTGNYLVSLVYAAPELNQMFVRRIRTLMDQYLGSATATTGPFETRISQLVDQLDPPGATYLTDADRELQKWGYWTDGSGAQLFSGTLDAAVHDHGVRKQALRILSANPTPTNPSSTATPELGNTTASLLRGRRTFL